MKKIIIFILINFTVSAQNFDFQRSWGTYFGDERFFLRDSKTDKQGNLYIVGIFVNGTSSSQPVFTYANGYQANYGGGDSDGFIAKFNNSGQLTWATYFGGDDIDTIEGVDFDSSNNLYIVGSTQSTTNIASVNANQSSLNGISDFFIAKFTPNGLLNWSTYYGGTDIEGINFSNIYNYTSRIFISHDQLSSFYISGDSQSTDLGTVGTFQPSKNQSSQIIAKFDNNSNHIWTTYYSAIGNKILTLKATSNSLYVRGRINNCNPNFPTDNGYYGSTNSYQPTALNCSNTFLSKFGIDGQRIWSTYYAELNKTGNKSLDVFQDKIYFSGAGLGSLVTTSGVFQETAGNEVPPYLVQFSANGTRDWGTYCGSNDGFPQSGSASDFDHITTDNFGALYLSGVTNLHTNFSTTGAYQTSLTGQANGYICKFDNQGQKIWGTYYGGNLSEIDMIIQPSIANAFFLVGTSTSSTNLTTQNCYQPNLVTYDIDNGTPKNIFVAYFEPLPLSNIAFNENSFSIYPNPVNDKLYIENKYNNTIQKIILYDLMGKTVIEQNGNNTELNFTNILSGLYLVKIITEQETIIKRIVKK